MSTDGITAGHIDFVSLTSPSKCTNKGYRLAVGNQHNCMQMQIVSVFVGKEQIPNILNCSSERMTTFDLQEKHIACGINKAEIFCRRLLAIDFW